MTVFFGALQLRTTLPKTVWILGLISLFMDMSSEFIHALLPVYLTTTLGLSVLAVGIVEGIAEATASIMKVFSGVISDRVRHRKPLLLAGYGLAALTKPVFPLAGSAFEVVGARFVDRIGKGIRGAPRDALVGDVTPPEQLNAAYGLRQSLDTVGAFAGPLLAMLILLFWSHDLRLVLWVAVIPALICVLLIVFGIRETPDPQVLKAKPRLHWDEIRHLPSAFGWLLGVTALVTLARMAEALLVLRAQENGLGLVWIPLVLVVFSAAYALSAYPAGLFGDRLGTRGLLLAGLGVLGLAQGLLAQAATVGVLFWGGIVLWGLHMGLTQGLLTAQVARLAPATLRGTSFGVFHLITGLMQLLAGIGFGWLWVQYSAATAFLTGMGLALAAMGLVWWRWGREAGAVS
ncbi:MAG TPA: MFS transporter [Thiolinea sp.]|nr:MFS transporter [Thiolinea sp.]